MRSDKQPSRRDAVELIDLMSDSISGFHGQWVKENKDADNFSLLYTKFLELTNLNMSGVLHDPVEVWKTIREVDTLTFYFLDCTSYWFMRTGMTESEYREIVVPVLANSIGWIESAVGVDQTISHRTVSTADLRNKLITDPWMSTLILLNVGRIAQMTVTVD